MKKYIIYLLSLYAIQGYAQKKERLQIDWPKEYKWKTIVHIQNKERNISELIPEKETPTRWTIKISTTLHKGIIKYDFNSDSISKTIYNKVKKDFEQAIYTLLDNPLVKKKWTLFKIEASSYKKSESQLYYIIQGQEGLYINIINIKEKKISKEFLDKWSTIFKTSKLIYQ